MCVQFVFDWCSVWVKTPDWCKTPDSLFGISSRFRVVSPIPLYPRFRTGSIDCLLSPGSPFFFPQFHNLPRLPDSKHPPIRRQLVSLQSVYLEPIWPISARWRDGYEKKPDGESSRISRWSPILRPDGVLPSVFIWPSGLCGSAQSPPQAQISFSPTPGCLALGWGVVALGQAGPGL